MFKRNDNSERILIKYSFCKDQDIEIEAISNLWSDTTVSMTPGITDVESSLIGDQQETHNHHALNKLGRGPPKELTDQI